MDMTVKIETFLLNLIVEGKIPFNYFLQILGWLMRWNLIKISKDDKLDEELELEKTLKGMLMHLLIEKKISLLNFLKSLRLLIKLNLFKIKPEITFEKGSESFVLSAFGHSVDKEGFIYNDELKCHALTPEGEEIRADELGVIAKGPNDSLTCESNTPAKRGFQILGPEGFRTFNQDDRLVLAMSSSAKPLVNSLKELSDRVLKSRTSPEKPLLPLVNELLKISQAQNAMQIKIGEITSAEDGPKDVAKIVEIAEKALSETAQNGGK